MAARLLGLCLGLAGCQAGAEIGWSIGPLQGLVPVGAHQRPGSVTLRLGLLGWDSAPLAAADRVRIPGGTYRLAGLGSASAQLRGGRVRGAAGSVGELASTPVALGYRGHPTPLRVVLLIDNGAVAAAADPGQARLSAARTLVQKSACAEGCALGPAEVSLVVMQGGSAEVKMAATRDSALLDGAVQALAQKAGGEAPLWDGLLLAAGEARANLPAGASAAVVLYSATGEPGPSRASPSTAQQVLLESPPVRLLAVQQQGSAPGLLAAAGASGGEWLAVGEEGIEGALRAAGAVLAGAWEISWQRPPSVDAERMLGTLELTVGPERRSAELDLPITP